MSSERRARPRSTVIAVVFVTTISAVALVRGIVVPPTIPADPSPVTAATAGNAPDGVGTTAAASSPTDSPSPSSSTAPGANDPASDDFVPTPPPGSVTIEGGSKESLAAAAEARAHELSFAYGEVAKLPPNNALLPAGHDPLTAAARPQHTKTTFADGSTLDLTISTWFLTAGEKVEVTASLFDINGAAVPIGAGKTAVLDTRQTGFLDETTLSSVSQGVVKGTWQAPSNADIEGDPGVHVLATRVVSTTGTTFSNTTSMQIGAAHVRLTGRYRSSIVDGSLVIGAEVIVTKRVRAHLALTIAPENAKDGPRVLAEHAQKVELGVQWIDVVAHGVAMRSLSAAGPYVLTAVQLQDTSTMPPARLPLARDAYVTAGYSLSEFRTDPFAQADLIELAHFLEER